MNEENELREEFRALWNQCPECPTAFVRSPSEVESKEPTCSIACRATRRRRLNRLNAERTDGLRICTTCMTEQPATSACFASHADPRRAHILRARCRDCDAVELATIARGATRPKRRRPAPEPPPCYTGPSDMTPHWDFEDVPLGELAPAAHPACVRPGGAA